MAKVSQYGITYLKKVFALWKLQNESLIQQHKYKFNSDCLLTHMMSSSTDVMYLDVNLFDMLSLLFSFGFQTYYIALRSKNGWTQVYIHFFGFI